MTVVTHLTDEDTRLRSVAAVVQGSHVKLAQLTLCHTVEREPINAQS